MICIMFLSQNLILQLPQIHYHNTYLNNNDMDTTKFNGVYILDNNVGIPTGIPAGNQWYTQCSIDKYSSCCCNNIYIIITTTYFFII